jgi:hypothetical protein
MDISLDGWNIVAADESEWFPCVSEVRMRT